ncbi:MAG: hypothetical protein FWD76_00490 [Firmicutes bacterium]|nr:hypothetical protein [Bacillota bacterium]
MIKRRLIVPLSPLAKFLHAMSNSIFSMLECLFLGLIVFYALSTGVSIVAVVVTVGLVLVFSALLIPLLTFLIDKTNNLYFGTYHGPLLISIFLVVIFNGQFWMLGEWDLGPVVTLVLLGFVSLINNIFLACYRYCTHSIGDRICLDKNDKRTFDILKSVTFLVGILLAVGLLGGMMGSGSIANIGFVASCITLVIGLVDFFVTYQYLPIIKLKEAAKKITRKERLRDIYVDFAKSISLKGHLKVFIGFCLSVVFFAMFFVSAYVYLSLFASYYHLGAAGLVGIGLLACIIGVWIFGALLSKKDKGVIVAANLSATIVWVVVFVAFYVLLAMRVLPFGYWTASIVIAVLGFLASANYVCFQKLFVDAIKPKIKAPYNLCTIVYIVCFGLVVIVVGIFANSLPRQDSTQILDLQETRQYVLISLNVFLAVAVYLTAAVLAVLSVQSKDKVKKIKAVIVEKPIVSKTE